MASETNVNIAQKSEFLGDRKWDNQSVPGGKLELQSLKHLRAVRNGHASYLTSILNSINFEVALEDDLIKFRVKIINTLKNLKNAHQDSVSKLTEDEVETAVVWFSARESAAVDILQELDKMMHNIQKSKAKDKSQIDEPVLCEPKYTPTSSSRHSLKLKAEQAKLKAKQAKQAVELVEKAAEIEAARVIQGAQHDAEMAELEARVFQDMADSENSESFKSLNIQKIEKPVLVKEWLDKQNIVKHADLTKTTEQFEIPVMTDKVQTQIKPSAHVLDPLVPSHAGLPDRKQFKPQVFSTPVIHRDNNHNIPYPSSMRNIQNPADEAIDSWIDNLVIGVETVIDDINATVSDGLVHMLARVESEKDLPKVELPTFSGEAIEWPRFIEQFHIQVHCRPGIRDTRRMDLLQSHLSGEAKVLVQGLGYSGKNYEMALQELKGAFGHRVKVAKAFLDKVTNGQTISSHDPTALRKFYVAIRDCVTTLQQLNYSADLGSCETLLKSVRRLPLHMAPKWNEYVKSVMKTREPSLLDLQSWLKDRVDAQFNPYAIDTSYVNKSANYKHEKQDKSSRVQRNFATTSQSKDQTRSCESTQNKSNTVPKSTETPEVTKDTNHKLPCPLCSEGHYLYRCALFANKSVQERLKVVKDNKLCYNCMKGPHSVSMCFTSRKCQQCDGRHHTMLHFDKTERPATNLKVRTKDTDRVYFRLVPVHAVGPNGRVIQTVAMLDSASDTSLVDSELSKELGLVGEVRDFTVKTLTDTTTQTSRNVCLSIKGIHGDSKPLLIKEAWTVNSDAFSCPAQVVKSEWKHMVDLDIPHIEPSQIQILIGLNVPEAHIQTDIRSGGQHQPYAVKTPVGWSIMGVAPGENAETQARVNFTVTQNTELNDQVKKFWQTESFGVAYESKSPSSIEDRRAQSILEETIHVVDGHYEVGMLWKRDVSKLPNNRIVAERRFRSLAKRLSHDEAFAGSYEETLNGYISKGHAQRLTQEEAAEISPRTWYLPHHGVTNPNKPGKVRIVFDAAAEYSNTSLNNCLMTGPDLLNSLFGVLVRFRLDSVALAADIEGMFHQVKVPAVDSDSLRFLWKPNMGKPGAPDVYRMTVHIFGAADSPSCANYALQRTALYNKDSFNENVIQAALNDFYVDDFLKSVESTSEAIDLSSELTQLMQRGGFRLHKWISNSPEVVSAIPECDRAVKTTDIEFDQQPVQRALGLKWDISEDLFTFDQKLKHSSMTKRGVVSTVSSIFDPCGFLAPFTLRAKCIIQELWRQRLDWDDPLPEQIQKCWTEWLFELESLASFKLPRHHQNLSPSVQWIELHVFCDASEKGFGAVVYLRYSHRIDCITCSIVASKTHVAPINPTLSIPRLELQAAVLGVRLWKSLQNELKLDFRRVMFWTDSNTVLQYINNETKRFKPFVSNRVSEILESTSSEQWHHVPTAQNPADHCSRGLRSSKLTTTSWLTGPEFLTESHHKLLECQPRQTVHLDENDPEVKGKCVMTLSTQDKFPQTVPLITLSSLLNPNDFSSWHSLCRRTAWLLRAIRNFMCPLKGWTPVKHNELLPQEYEEATLTWVCEVQSQEFSPELKGLKGGSELPTTSKLLPLSPIFDGRHLRVGGRLRKAVIPSETKFQLIMPRDHQITKLLMDDVHKRTAHGGPEHMVSELRQKFWVVSARRIAKEAIRRCLDCHRRHVKPMVPKMADLPLCRVSGYERPFIYTGVDYFGPVQVKVRRSSVKRWGCLFTCLSTRAVHIELADSLETDDFILVLRNFIGRRGHPRHMYSDNGTNFVGADNELRQCLRNLKQNHISGFLALNMTEWHFNPPLSPHFGGAWERLVRSVKTALKATLRNTHVSDSVLRTALIEVEAVLNSRPLTHNSSDPKDFVALTPNHFLLGRGDTSVPPDVFSDREINSRRKWRQAQVIADHVSRRWLKEYLPELTVRHRWTKENSNVCVGDLVLVVANNHPRGQWELGRILDILPGTDGRVRTVRVKTPAGDYVRPTAKICVLEENVLN